MVEVLPAGAHYEVESVETMKRLLPSYIRFLSKPMPVSSIDVSQAKLVPCWQAPCSLPLRPLGDHWLAFTPLHMTQVDKGLMGKRLYGMAIRILGGSLVGSAECGSKDDAGMSPS